MRNLQIFLFSAAALLATFGGLFSIAYALFLPLVLIGTIAMPKWLNPYTFVGLGLLLLALGTWLWILAWRRSAKENLPS